jgi:hypothetical protein
VSVRWLALCLVFGCRSHEQVCDGVDCVDSSAGAGGAAPIEPEAAAGAGGAADVGVSGAGEVGAHPGRAGAPAIDTPECDGDADCDDRVSCNGAETCADGACTEGESPSCEHGTQCVEGSPVEPCEFAQRSPWLLLLSDEKVRGLPTAELGKRELIELGERTSTGANSSFTEVQWSADGRRAFVSFDTGSAEALSALYFGSGLPSSLDKVSNLPDTGAFSYLSFSPDASRALLNDADSSGFLLELAEPQLKTSLVDYDFLDRGEDLQLSFCVDHKTWIDHWADPLARVAQTDDGLEVTLLDGHWAEVSPDGRFVFLASAEPTLGSCVGKAEPVTLELRADYAHFSPQSSHLLLIDGDAGHLLSLEDPSSPLEIWTYPDMYFVGWTPDGSKLVVQLKHEDTETLAYVDIASGEPVAPHDLLEYPSQFVEACGNGGCAVWLEPEEFDGDDLFYVPFAASKPAHQLFDGAEPVSLDWIDCDRGLAVIERALESSAHGVNLVRFDDDGSSERQLLKSFADSGFVTVATDASGIAIQMETGGVTSNTWVRLPAEGEEPVSVPLGAGHITTFQPWP